MAKVTNKPDTKGNMHCCLYQGNDYSCAFATAGMAYYLCKGYQSFNPEIEDYMASCSKALGQTWTFSGGGIGLDDTERLLNYVGINTAGLKMTTPSGIHDLLKFWAWDYTPVIVCVWKNWGEKHAVLCKRVYTDGTCVFLDPSNEYGLVTVPGNKMPQYYTPWDTQYTQPIGKIVEILLPTQLS